MTNVDDAAARLELFERSYRWQHGEEPTAITDAIIPEGGYAPLNWRDVRAVLDALACPTPCDEDCDAACHEEHDPVHKRQHEPWRHSELNRLQERAAAVEALLTSGPIGRVSGERYVRADLIREALGIEEQQ